MAKADIEGQWDRAEWERAVADSFYDEDYVDYVIKRPSTLDLVIWGIFGFIPALGTLILTVVAVAVVTFDAAIWLFHHL